MTTRERPNGNRYSELHVAMVCHDALARLSAVHELMHGPAEGDATDAAPLMHLHPDLIDAAVNGVIKARSGMTSPAEHHAEWVRFLTQERGWKQGPRNPEEKTHPNLGPWTGLTHEQRDKNLLYLGTVVSMTLVSQ